MPPPPPHYTKNVCECNKKYFHAVKDEIFRIHESDSRAHNSLWLIKLHMQMHVKQLATFFNSNPTKFYKFLNMCHG
jgi:hypothetical protein